MTRTETAKMFSDTSNLLISLAQRNNDNEKGAKFQDAYKLVCAEAKALGLVDSMVDYKLVWK